MEDVHCLRHFCLYKIFSIKKVLLADAHAHVQRLVSVVKMAPVLDECNAEEQRSVVRLCGQNDSVQR
jgi:hypothetical protein